MSWKKRKSGCYSTVYKCEKCGSVGCDKGIVQHFNIPISQKKHKFFLFATVFVSLILSLVYPILAQSSSDFPQKKQLQIHQKPAKQNKKKSKNVKTKNTEVEKLRVEVARQRQELDQLKAQDKANYPSEAIGKTLIPGPSDCECWINASNPKEKFEYEKAHHRFIRKR